MALYDQQVKIIRGMIARGDKQHDIAAWFGENQARIAEAEAGKYGEFAAAPAEELPPKGAPGPKGRRLHFKVKKALEALEKGDTKEAQNLLKAGLADYDKNDY